MLEHYIRQLNDLYDGEPWYGDSLLDKLDAFSPEIAFVVPAPGVHSIAQIVAHMLVWRRVLIEHLKGNTQFRPEADSPEDWNTPTKLKTKGWEKLLSELADNQEELLGLLKTKSEAWLENPYRDGHTYRFLIEGVIQHDVYHIGQIGLLGKILSTSKKINLAIP